MLILSLLTIELVECHLGESIKCQKNVNDSYYHNITLNSIHHWRPSTTFCANPILPLIHEKRKKRKEQVPCYLSTSYN
ncbi:hypothetical protein V8C34DRAFT_234167 [Trichoderma compactum]